jgi:hypothetical protein
MLFNYGMLLRLWQSKFNEAKILGFLFLHTPYGTQDGQTDGWMEGWMN